MKLSEFENRDLQLALDSPIFHPYRQTVVGRMGTDDKGRRVAVFMRDPDEHFFRKHEGYAVSVSVLEGIFNQGAKVVYIAEKYPEKQDRRIIEYDISDFANGILIAYSPKENTVVEGEVAVEQAKEHKFSDKQRVVNTDVARRIWTHGEYEIDA